MKKQYLVIIATLSLFLFATGAGATAISITPTGAYPMAAGDTVSFDVLFTADDDGDSFEGLNLNFGYDATELSFVSYAKPLEWEEMFGPVENVTEDEGSFLLNYNQSYSWSGTPLDVAANQSISVGTFTFEATDGLTGDGLSDLWLIDSIVVDELTNNSKVSFNNNYGVFVSTVLTDQGADVSAVPVPGAVWLMITGLLGAVGVKRRKA